MGSTLKSCVRKHRLEARKLAKSRISDQLSMRRKRRVRFHPSVKKHDGISTANAHLERVIYDFWKKQKLDLLAELSRDSKHTDLNNLIIKLSDLLHRMRQSGDKNTVLLPRGGGTAAKMSKLHIPHVHYLLQSAIQVRGSCMRRHETNCTLLFRRKISDDLGLVLDDPDANIDANIDADADADIDADIDAIIDAALDAALDADADDVKLQYSIQKILK